MSGSVRDVVANRSILNGQGVVTPHSVVTPINAGDIAIPDFVPTPNAIHLTVPTAARAWTITEASIANLDLKEGEGFTFSIQNNSAGAFAITLTLGGGGQVASGAGTFTIAQANTRQFMLVRTGASHSHVLHARHFGSLRFEIHFNAIRLGLVVFRRPR